MPPCSTASLANPPLATATRGLANRLQHATDLAGCRDLEAQAANVYFSAWTAVTCRFATRDQARVPAHWQHYTVRSSPLTRSGHSVSIRLRALPRSGSRHRVTSPERRQVGACTRVSG